MNHIPVEITDILKNFIDKNDLGPIKTFYAEDKPKRDYTEIEKKRLKNLINICEKFITKQIALVELKNAIKNSLQISDELAANIYQEIETASKKYPPRELDGMTNNHSYEKSSSNDKKSLFSVLLDEKK